MDQLRNAKASSIKQLFRRFDTNGRGTLCRNQLFTLLKRLSDLNENDFDLLLNTANPQTSDSSIDYDAFVDFLCSREGMQVIGKQPESDPATALKAALCGCSDNLSFIQPATLATIISEVMATSSRRKSMSLLAAQILKQNEAREADKDYESRLHKIFNDSDIDGSGDMSVNELALALDMEKDMAEEFGWNAIAQTTQITDIVKLFNQADTDNSGQLSWDEFAQIMKSYRKEHEKDAELRAQSAAENLAVALHRRRPTRKMTMATINIYWWEINYWELADEDEMNIWRQSLNSWGILSDLNLDLVILHNFFLAIKRSYRAVPYHNFQHAMSTLHYVFLLGDAARIGDALLKEQLFALLVAALCHDCDHRGRNTAFEVATMSILALRYNDKSPLENHHCATAFQLAFSGSGECNIFKGVTVEALRIVRQHMVTGILGTDMCFHNDHVKRLQHMRDAAQLLEDSEFTVELFLHAADIGNPMMTSDISHKWGCLINDEFTQQVEEETRLGLPVTAMMFGLEDEQKAAKAKIGFIEFVIKPLVRPLFDLFPELSEPNQHLEDNLADSKKLLL